MNDKDIESVVTAGATANTVAVESRPDSGRLYGSDSGDEPTPDLAAHRLRQQAALSEFGLQALQMSDLPRLIQIATELCARGMSVRLCKALRYDSKANSLLICAGVGWKEGTIGQTTVGTDLASPAGFALHTGKPVISNHLENEERFRTPQVMIEHGVRRAINVLITAHQQPWGVLEVDSPDEGKFEIEDIGFMQGFANLLGIAIERYDAETKLQEALAHQRLLVQEASHRVKNSLTMVSSLLHLQARGAVSKETVSALGEAEARIATIAEAHDQLWRSTSVGQIDAREFLSDLCARLQRQSATVTIEADIDSLALDAERAIAVGLLVTELATNAIKYAYPGRDGIVMIELRNDREEFRLSVSDQGQGLPQPFDLKKSGRHSLGMRMIDSLTRQLQGRIDISSSGRTKFTITAPR